jgi:excisionase family DNA binding protein
MGNEDRFITAREAAELFGLNLFTVYRKALERELPSYKLGRCRRFSERELREWAARNHITANKATPVAP